MLVSAVRHTAQLTWHWEDSAKAGGIVKFVQNYVCVSALHIAHVQRAIAKHYIFVPVEFVRDYVCIVYNTLSKAVMQSFTYLNF